ncbi:aromatic ring-hydroxylating dioxygenase subunit alpha [Sphingomonas populi]|uniref:Aromatic ring-hydroxylating dioxygenase subunit alpha n=1 Tax=Sphingomonas populi TaxID=2484750 RepID=A0A4Q6XZW8_9SPHN|nr:aromatic ring-hydroxylating dioxygenase subunit alpha [Sphingomonas populi]RZF63442.1 aromatic ring-hydroxylating dioxygenase subunit alpha [Sphingomonas populi]
MIFQKTPDSAKQIANELVREETREVSMRVMSDPQVYEMEMETIFQKTWIFLGHDTEIPKAGDFVTRKIGNDAVIVSRAASGDVHVFLNVCPHRGMRVCGVDSGNSALHRCIYHGWAFRSDGSFFGAPVEREQMHGKMTPKSELGLKNAKVHIYNGFIFATWNENPEPFDDFLGDMKYYMDTLVARTDNGLEVLGPPQRVRIRGNWKTAGEQSTGDGFHTLTLHRSLMEAGQMGGSGDSIYDNAPAMYGQNISTDQGHGGRCIPPEMTFSAVMGTDIDKCSVEERLDRLPPPGLTREMIPQIYRHLDEGQIEVLARSPLQAGGLFPNASFVFLFAPDVNGEFVGLLGMHLFQPLGPDEMELYTWLFAEKDAPEDMKRRMRAVGVQAVGSSGVIEQDDTETWSVITQSSKGVMGSRGTLKYQAITGEHTKPADWPGPGHVYDGFTKDDTQWNWWVAYKNALAS